REAAAAGGGCDKGRTDPLEHKKALRLPARRHNRGRGDADVDERGARARKPMACDRLVADNRDSGGRTQRGDPLTKRGKHPAADHDVVAAFAKRDSDNGGLTGAKRRGHDPQSPLAAAVRRHPASPRGAASAPTISSTIVSCGISSDW